MASDSISSRHPFAAELTARASQIGAKLRTQQDESDARGCYSDEIHRELLDAGFYRILQPRMFNGGGGDCETYIRVIFELSRGHPGSGWCYALASSHALVVGAHFEEEVQRELFGSEGDFRAAFAAGPVGTPTFERRDGGYCVSGLWAFASGIPVCTHFLGGAFIPGVGGAPAQVAFVVPRSSIEVLPDWGGDAAMGMLVHALENCPALFQLPDNLTLLKRLLLTPLWNVKLITICAICENPFRDGQPEDRYTRGSHKSAYGI